MESELQYGDKAEIPLGDYTIPIGKAHCVIEGKDITVITHGRTVTLCKEAARYLKDKDISVELIDLRTIKPLDLATILRSVKKTNHCVVVEEGHIFSGITAEVGFLVQQSGFDYLDAPILRVCQKETPMPYSKVLEKQTLPTVERIVTAITQTLNK